MMNKDYIYCDTLSKKMSMKSLIYYRFLQYGNSISNSNKIILGISLVMEVVQLVVVIVVEVAMEIEWW